MDHTKDTLLELIRGTLSTTIYNQGVYILNIEEILDNYKRRMFHAGFLYAGREWNGQIHDKLPFPYLKKR